MKTETFRKVNLHSVMITLFFVGIIGSGGYLFAGIEDLNRDTLYIALMLTGLTFLFGILSVSLVSRAENRKVIYLEKRAEEQRAIIRNEVTSVRIDQSRLSQTLASQQEWLSELCFQLEAAQAALYTAEGETLELKHGYSLIRHSTEPIRYSFGEGIVGRVAAEKTVLRIDELPEGYMTVVSGLGQASPRHLMVFPIKTGDRCIGVLEISSFTPFSGQVVLEIETAIRAFAENTIKN